MLFLPCLAIFPIQFRSTCSGMILLRVSWVVPHQLVIKKMSPQVDLKEESPFFPGASCWQLALATTPTHCFCFLFPTILKQIDSIMPCSFTFFSRSFYNVSLCRRHCGGLSIFMSSTDVSGDINFLVLPPCLPRYGSLWKPRGEPVI